MTIISLEDHKKKRELLKVLPKLVEELSNIKLLLDLSMKGLSIFQHHKQVAQLLPLLQNHAQLTNIYLDKHKTLLDNLKKLE